MDIAAISFHEGGRIVDADTESTGQRSLPFKFAAKLEGHRERLDGIIAAAASTVKTTPDSDTPHEEALNSDLLVNGIPPTCARGSDDDRVSYGNAERAYRGISVGKATCGGGKDGSMTTSRRDTEGFVDEPVPPIVDEERIVFEAIKGFRCSATSKALRWGTDDGRLDAARMIGGERNFDLGDGSITDKDSSLVLSGGGRGRGCQEPAGHAYEENECLLKVIYHNPKLDGD